MEPFGQRWAAGADPEREATLAAPLEARRAEGDGGRCAPPCRDNRGAETDVLSACRELSEQDHRVVRQTLREVDTVKTQLVGLAPEPQDEIGAGLKGRERHADTALLSIFSTLERLIGSSGGCVVVML
jgi:hypothetical protein